MDLDFARGVDSYHPEERAELIREQLLPSGDEVAARIAAALLRPAATELRMRLTCALRICVECPAAERDELHLPPLLHNGLRIS